MTLKVTQVCYPWNKYREYLPTEWKRILIHNRNLKNVHFLNMLSKKKSNYPKKWDEGCIYLQSKEKKEYWILLCEMTDVLCTKEGEENTYRKIF